MVGGGKKTNAREDFHDFLNLADDIEGRQDVQDVNKKLAGSVCFSGKPDKPVT